MAINPGYRGIAQIGAGNYVRFTDANISAKQEINAPDLVMGDWDHDAYVYGPITVGGTISGPVTELFVSGAASIWQWAVKRTGNCGTLSTNNVNLWYYCGTGNRKHRNFTGMLVNSINFSCAAGDIANFSLDVMGSGVNAWDSTDAPLYQTNEKLMTWDRVNLTISNPRGDLIENAYSNFDFTISNNLQVVYSLGQSNLFPYQIVPGLRTISGSISIYNIPTADGADTWSSYTADNGPATLTFNIGTASFSFKAALHRVEPALGVGPIISTVNFTGVTHQTGLDA